MHLIIDGYCTHTKLLKDPDALKNWMLNTIELLGLHSYGEIRIYDYPFPGREGTALSAVIFLGESSFTVHTYPEHSFIFIDIFHCHNFDIKKCHKWVTESLGIDKPVTYLFKRGLDRSGKPVPITPAFIELDEDWEMICKGNNEGEIGDEK